MVLDWRCDQMKAVGAGNTEPSYEDKRAKKMAVLLSLVLTMDGHSQPAMLL